MWNGFSYRLCIVSSGTNLYSLTLISLDMSWANASGSPIEISLFAAEQFMALISVSQLVALEIESMLASAPPSFSFPGDWQPGMRITTVAMET